MVPQLANPLPEPICDNENLGKKTFILATFETYYSYALFEIFKISVLPFKDIVLLNLRIRFIKTFDISTFSIWLTFELLFPILV